MRVFYLYCRGGVYRDRSKSRDCFYYNSLEVFLMVLFLGFGFFSLDVIGCKDFLEDVFVDVI